MGIIQAAHYGETEARLAQDPIVIAMAKGLADTPRSELVHDNGSTPRFEFMQAANAEYRKRGGTDGGHIGAVAQALLRVLDAPAAKVERDPAAELASIRRFAEAVAAQGARRVEEAHQEFEETDHSCYNEGHAAGFAAAAKLVLDFVKFDEEA